MRKKYIIDFITMLLIFIVDYVVQNLFNGFGFEKIYFMSSLHFIALVIYSRKDERVYMTLKVLAVCFYLDLVHYNSFPVYYFSYGVSILIARIWHRHIGETYLEKTILVSLSIFIKEILLYLILNFKLDSYFTFSSFIVNRSLWVVIINAILLFIPLILINRAEDEIKKITHV